MSLRMMLAPLVFAVASLAQAPQAATLGAPPEIDQALRSRVDQFFRYHVEGGASLRRAMDMVAEDTKDEYFSSGKLQVLKYEVTEIEYGENFQRATVTLDVSRNVAVLGQLSALTLPMRTLWKIEDGQWMWYLDPAARRATPMSEGPAPGGVTPPETRGGLPPDFTSPEALAARARSILQGARLDKQSVTLRWGQPSEDRVTLLHEYPGADLELSAGPEVPGLRISVEKVTLKANENGVVRFEYAPPPGFDPTRALPPMPFFVQLTVVPFNRVFRIEVSFTTR